MTEKGQVMGPPKRLKMAMMLKMMIKGLITMLAAHWQGWRPQVGQDSWLDGDEVIFLGPLAGVDDDDRRPPWLEPQVARMFHR